MDIRKTIGDVAGQFKQAITPILGNLNKTYQVNVLKAQQSAQNVQRLVGMLTNSYQTPVQQRNPFVGLNPQQIIKTISDQPLFQPPSFGFKSSFKSPTLGQATDFLADIPRGIARAGWEGAQTLSGDKNTYQFKAGVLRHILDDRPLQNWADPKRPGARFAKDIGHPELTAPLIATGLALDLTPIGAGKSKLAKEGLEKAAKEEGLHKLRELMTYEDQLARWGLNKSERAKYGVNKAREFMAQGLEGINKEKQNKFDGIFQAWIGEREVAKTTAFQVGSKFKDIPHNLGWDVITLIENPGAKVSKEALKYIGGIKKEYDELFKSAQKAGINTGYLKSYISHIYQGSPEAVQVALSAGQKFRFSKKRYINTYEEAMAKGKELEAQNLPNPLKPKYDHPAEILAEYSRRLEVTKANIAFFKQLKKQGIIVDSAEGQGRLGYSPIVGQGFPASIVKGEDGVIQGSHYAPAPIANLINRMFSEADPTKIEKVADVGANISGRLQDFHLAGGLPLSPFNAFSLTAGLQKEALAGRFLSPTVNFLRSFSNKKTDEFFTDNIETIKSMQRNGITFSGLDITRIVDRGFIGNLTRGNSALEKLGTAWHSSFNEKSFTNFFPSLQISFFKDTYQKALVKYGEIEAERIATEATKRFYGLISSADKAKRSKLGSDLITIGFFAPRYREALLRFLNNVVQNSLPVKRVDGAFKANNPFNLENQHQTRFLIGAITTYLTYDYFNKSINGKHLHENPRGHELEILIPVSKITNNSEDDTVLRLPFLPSILTIPRMAYHAGSQALSGENVGALRTLRGLTSTGLQVPLGLAFNENFWGQPIYGEKGQGVGNYVFEQLSHPYMGAVNEQFGFVKNKPPGYQTLIKALEVPIRFTTEKKLDAKQYYAVRDEVLKSLNEEERKAFELVSKKNTGDIKQVVLEARMRLNYPNVLKVETEIARKVAEEKGENVRPFYLLPQKFQNIILTYQSLAPSSERSAVINQNLGFLKEYWIAEESYWAKVNENSNKEIAIERTDSKIQQKLDTYYSLQKGTGERSRYVANNPDLVKYWEEKKIENNQKRVELGLAPMPEQSFNSGSKYSSYKRRGRKLAKVKVKKISIKLPKASKIKLKSPKIAKVKLPKLKDIELPKLNMRRYA